MRAKWLLLAVLLAVPSLARAQAFSGVASSISGQPIPFATITACNGWSDALVQNPFQPCTAVLSALAIWGNVEQTASKPSTFSADASGRYLFFSSAAEVTITIAAPGYTTYSMIPSSGGGGGGGGGGSGITPGTYQSISAYGTPGTGTTVSPTNCFTLGMLFNNFYCTGTISSGTTAAFGMITGAIVTAPCPTGVSGEASIILADGATLFPLYQAGLGGCNPFAIQNNPVTFSAVKNSALANNVGTVCSDVLGNLVPANPPNVSVSTEACPYPTIGAGIAIVNGNFEQPTYDQTAATLPLPPQGWEDLDASVDDPGATQSYDTTTAPANNPFSFKMTCTTFSGGECATAGNTFVAVLPGQQYTATVWTKSDGTAPASICLNFIESNIVTGDEHFCSQTLSTSWVQISVTAAATMTEDILFVSLTDNEISPPIAGSIWFQDVQLFYGPVLANHQPVVGGGGAQNESTLSTSFGNLTSTCAGAQTWALASAWVANAKITLTGSCTLNLTNPLAGGNYVLEVIQGSGGSHTLTLGTGCTWKVGGGGGGAVTPTTTAGAIDVLAFTFDGTNCLATYGKNFN